MNTQHRLVRVAAMVTVVAVLSGCQTETITGRRQFILTSQQEEAQLGLQSWQEVSKEQTACTDKAKVAAVERVGKAISAVVTEAGFEWEFKTFESEEANAFCLPGGKVAVYSGLFAYLANDGELAAVIGHEIGHAVARHGGERMTQAKLQAAGASALSWAVDGKSETAKNLWMAAYGGVSKVGFLLPYSREHEYAADKIGTVFMARAGYDPTAALDFWNKFGAAGQGKLQEFMSTHPSGPHRIAGLQELMPAAKKEYGAAKAKRGYGATYAAPARK